jgi:hypothetical protein
MIDVIAKKGGLYYYGNATEIKYLRENAEKLGIQRARFKVRKCRKENIRR